MTGFLQTLCGPTASELNVKDKDKYNFDPKKLLAQIASIILRSWTQECKQAVGVSGEGFLMSFGTHPEFSQGVIERWASVLRKHSLLDPRGLQNYEYFLEEVEKFVHDHVIRSKNISPLFQVGKIRNEFGTSEIMDTSQSSGVNEEGAPANQEDNWQREAEAVYVEDDDLREFYRAALEGSKYDSAELQEVHLFASKAQTTLDPRSEPSDHEPCKHVPPSQRGACSVYLCRSVKVKAIMREMKQLEESLPVHPDSAIFLRQVHYITHTHTHTHTQTHGRHEALGGILDSCSCSDHFICSHTTRSICLHLSPVCVCVRA